MGKSSSKYKPPKAHIAQKFPTKMYSTGRLQHRKTGNPKGGWRPGAGRPLGSPNDLPTGAITAIKATNLRIPEGTPIEHIMVADAAAQRVIDVMLGRVHSSIAQPVLKAATVLREEICGAVTRNLNVKAEASITTILDEMSAIEKTEAAVVSPKPPALPAPPVIHKKGVA